MFKWVHVHCLIFVIFTNPLNPLHSTPLGFHRPRLRTYVLEDEKLGKVRIQLKILKIQPWLTWNSNSRSIEDFFFASGSVNITILRAQQHMGTVLVRYCKLRPCLCFYPFTSIMFFLIVRCRLRWVEEQKFALGVLAQAFLNRWH